MSKCTLSTDNVFYNYVTKEAVYDNLPLKAGDFRLLRLEPSPELEKPLVMHLCVRTIASSKDCYDAISYHWGDTTDRCTVKVNGMECSVGKNLAAALKYMRNASLDKLLWIDGLCINQEDINERGHQVARMGRIYSWASRVRIWLGEATSDVEAAISLVSRPQTWSEDDNLCIVKHVRSDQVGAIGLKNLLRRPYWQRMWVFQEIVLARHAVVHCGTFDVPWSHFRDMDTIAGDQRMWAHVPMSEFWVHDLRKAFFGIAQFCIQRDQTTDINNILYPTRSLKCTDPRDKIFALVGVCGMSTTVSLVPDYTRSVRHVYTDFTRPLVEKDFLSLLTAGLWNPMNGPDISLPTWVPDYRGTCGVNVRYLAASYLEYFNASMGRDGLYRFLTDEKGERTRLRVRGGFLETIQESILLQNGVTTQQVVEQLIDQQSSTPNVSFSQERPSLDAVFRSMIFEDPTLSPQSNPDRLARLALGFAHDLLRASDLLSDRGTSKHMSTLVEEFLASSQATLESHPEEILSESYARYIRDDAEQLHWFRKEYLARSGETSQASTPSIFSTRRHRIGKGLETVASGDQLAVIFGCRIPVVLRPFGQFYQFVGPCYVNGIMNGEGLEEIDAVFGAGGLDIILV